MAKNKKKSGQRPFKEGEHHGSSWVGNICYSIRAEIICYSSICGINFSSVVSDISIICDKSKLSEKGCTGCPDVVIEIISLTGASRDQIKN